jgi:acyl-CoA synthetase (AMP-forming)/AMP-acid ligase II
MLAHDLIAHHARLMPDATAWTFEGQRTGWAELAHRVERLSANLRRFGIGPGDPVGLFSENSDALAELYFALSRAGAVAVPINPRSVLPEVNFILKDVGARVLVLSDTLYARLAEAGPPSFAASDIVVIGTAPPGTTPFPELYAAGPDITPATDPNAIRAIKYTSGTTGKPKGCISTQQQYLYNIQQYLINVPFDKSDICTVCLPMTAGVGIYLLTSYVYSGCQTTIMGGFRPDTLLSVIERDRVTRFYAVPTMLKALTDRLRAIPSDVSSLRLVGYGGSPTPAGLVEEAMGALACGFYQTFGASESGGFVTYLMPDAHLQIAARRRATDAPADEIMPCGREVQGFEVRLVDEAGQDVPNGHVGELWIRCDSLMSGYWRQPERTQEVLGGGFLRSGDLGMRDADGNIRVVDRKRDMIISGGLNIFSSEVEAALFRHAAVREAAVIGEPDAYWGEAVVACLVADAPTPELAAAIAAHARANLASYKRPRRYLFFVNLPKTSTGKIRKADLRPAARGDEGAAVPLLEFADSPK